MTGQVISFRGHWLAAECLRLHKELEEKRRRYPLLGELWDAVDILEAVGTDLKNRGAVRRDIAPAPTRYRGNRGAYNAFIELCIEEARRMQSVLDDKASGGSR
jgi:hypothetical protein